MESRNHIDELLAKSRSGHRASFDALVRSQADELDRYVRLRLGTHLREYVEVDDVLQEAYTRAFQSISTIRDQDEDSFRRWISRIVENVILETVRRQRHDRVVFLERDVASGDPSPSKGVRREERFDRFEDALRTLAPDYRQVVLLSRIEGLRIKEIADRMNRTPKAVTHLLARAMTRLKDLLVDTESLSLPRRRLEGGEPEDE